jgi:quercetin dioxygenase-like cupin family protein
MVFSFCLAAWLSAQDRKLAEPDMKVFLENDHVRVQEHSLKPGQKAPMHSHPCYVIYTTKDATVRFTLPDGSTREAMGKAGAVYWHNAGSHAVENIGDSDVRNIVVEIKNCKAAQ